MPSPTYYCDSDDVRRAAGRADSWGTEEATAVGNWIPRAQKRVDEITGTWFDTRTVTVTTEAARVGQVKLFLPAPLVEIDTLTEDGEALEQGVDFFSYGWYLEKADKGAWTTKQQAIVIAGDFGMDSVPGDIVEATAQMAAVMSGLKSRTYIDGAGITQSSLVTSMPAWVTETIQMHKRPSFDGQTFIIETA